MHSPHYIFPTGGGFQSGLHCTTDRARIWLCFSWWQECCNADCCWRLGKGFYLFCFYIYWLLFLYLMFNLNGCKLNLTFFIFMCRSRRLNRTNRKLKLVLILLSCYVSKNKLTPRALVSGARYAFSLLISYIVHITCYSMLEVNFKFVTNLLHKHYHLSLIAGSWCCWHIH